LAPYFTIAERIAMTALALIIKHKTQRGRRDEVRKIWERHMAPAIASNPGHTAYFYCFDNTDPDSIYAFQQYSSVEASQDFLQKSSYVAYLKDVEPLLAGAPQVTALTPMWSKKA
jgi:quinol monooxygenase YgiN